MIEEFKKHWFPSLLALCAAVAAFTWGVAIQLIERPLKDQLAQRDSAKSANPTPIVFVAPSFTQQNANSDISTTDGSGVSKVSYDSKAYSESCAILEAGNALYIAKKYPEALEAYSAVQRVDKIGTTPCTASIYATMATVHTLLAAPLVGADPSKAAEHYKAASLWNKSFAVALLCQAGDCKLAKQFLGT